MPSMSCLQRVSRLIRFVRSGVFPCVLAVVACTTGDPGPDSARGLDDVGQIVRPNVLFISVDDLNDWIEPLGGHPQTVTPNIQRLADERMTFTRAFTPSPSCNPARTALLTGLHTYTSGMYSNYQYWREVMPDVVTLPGYFRANGYWAGGAGKIFHNDQPDPVSWDEYFPALDRHMPSWPRPESAEPTVNMPPFPDMYGAFDWGPLQVGIEETGDYQSVSWVIDQLRRSHDRPFFLAAGIYRPHLPWYVPEEYFDKFPLETVQLPPLLDDDVVDLPERAMEIAHRGGDYHGRVVEAGQWAPAVQGYLASINYADEMVGRLLDALDASAYADNTVVVLWSDHGWQFGQKEHWRKFALWENLARVVLIARVPEGVLGLPAGTSAGTRSGRTVSLLDLYPTLVELADLPGRP